MINSKKDIAKRYAYKRKLFELAQIRGLTRKEIVALFRFIRYIVVLPAELSAKLDNVMSNNLIKTTMTIPTEQDRIFINDLFQAVHRMSFDEYVKQQTDLGIKEEAEKEKLRIKEEAEKEKLRIKQEAEKEKLIVKQEAEKEKQQVIKKLLLKNVFSFEEIAEINSVSIEKVIEIQQSLNTNK